MIGDLLQLSPFGRIPVFVNYEDNWKNFDLLWRHFKIFELTEVMHHRGGDRLNYMGIARPQPVDLKLL